MNRIAVFVGISIVALAIGCKKSPELATEYIPVFNGNVETNVSYKKVVFSSSFHNLDPANAQDCGFEWSKSAIGIINTATIGAISKDNFSVQLAVKLEEGVEYQVRAWIKVGIKKFYSQPSYFFGTVTLKPEIISLNRNYALWGDTIRIKMKNLAPDVLPQDFTVSIDNSDARTVFADSTEIEVLMPFSLTKGNLKINILVNNQSCVNTAEIENAIPEVTSVSPDWVHFDNQISIKGKFRSEYSKRIVPVESDWFTLYRYKLLSFTDNEIVIQLSDQLACNSQNYISLKIISAQGAEEQFNTIYTGFSIKRIEHWKRLNQEASYLLPKGAVLNDEAYVLEKSVGWPPTAFWKYNTKTDQWSALSPCPVIIPDDGCMEVCNGKIYAGFLRTTYQNSNFYSYDTQTNTWKECADLPFQGYETIRVSATIQNKIYVFMSGSNKKAIYDPVNDSWSFSSCIVPDFISPSRMFIYNGEYYFYKGIAAKTIYKYDLLTDSFSPIIFEGLGYRGGTFFTLNSRFYLSYDCKVYEFNMLDKKLVEKPELANTISDYNAYGDDSFLFELNSKAYFIFAQNYMVSLSPENK